MAGIPCPVCGKPGASLAKHCSGVTVCTWGTCTTCGAHVDRLKTDGGRPRHTHHSVKAEHCLICAPVPADDASD